MQQINLYFLDDEGQLIQMNTTGSKRWDRDAVRNSTGAAIKPLNDTSLAATWYSYTTCPDCSYNAFVAYQDADSGRFQVVNASRDGDVQHIDVPSNPLQGSSSTFDLQWRSDTRANLRLGYQLESGQIASAIWNGGFSYRPSSTYSTLNDEKRGY